MKLLRPTRSSLSSVLSGREDDGEVRVPLDLSSPEPPRDRRPTCVLIFVSAGRDPFAKEASKRASDLSLTPSPSGNSCSERPCKTRGLVRRPLRTPAPSPGVPPIRDPPSVDRPRGSSLWVPESGVTEFLDLPKPVHLPSPLLLPVGVDGTGTGPPTPYGSLPGSILLSVASDS